MGNLLNFSDWHMKDSQGDRAVLEHKDGHTMSIAVGALPRIQREQIKRLKMAAGGKVKRYEGGSAETVSQDDNAPTSEAAPKAAAGAPAVNLTINAGGGNNPQPVDNQAQSGAAAPPQAILPKGIAPQFQGAAPAAVPAAPDAQAPLLSDQTLNAPAAVNLQQKAIGQQQQIEAAKGQAQASYEDAYLKQQADIAQRQQENYNELHGHTEEFRKYMAENPINPNAYLESRNTGQKMATAIGLLAGGIKQGFLGGSNPAMDYLNNQINRNIEAQKARADQQKTVWGAYKQLYGDSNVATNLAKVSANDMLVHNANLMAAKLGTPQAAATANALRAQKQIENHQLLIDTSGRLGTLKTGATGGAPQAPGAAPAAQGKGNELGAIQPILHQGAQNMFNGLQWDPTAKQDYEQTRAQFTAAQQADKALQNLGPAFDKLLKYRTESNRIEKQTESLQDLPFHIGEILHGPAKSLAYAQPEHRAYLSSQTELLSDLTNAFRGTNVSGEEIKKVVMDNSPVAGDGPKEIKQKRDAIEGFIKRSVPASLLQKFRMTNVTN